MPLGVGSVGTGLAPSGMGKSYSGKKPMYLGPSLAAQVGPPAYKTSVDDYPGQTATESAGGALAAGVTGVAFPVLQGAQQAQQMQQYYDALMNVANTQTTGTNAGLALEQEFAKQQYDWAVAQATGQYGYENQLNNQAAQRARWDVNINQLRGEGLESQLGYLGQKGDVGAQRFGTNQAAMQQYIGLTRDQYNADLAHIGNQYGFNTREYEIAKQQIDAQYRSNAERFAQSNEAASLSFDRQSRLARSDAITRGALGSSGFESTRRELGRERTLAEQVGGTQFRETQANLAATMGRATLGYDVTNTELDAAKVKLGNTFKGELTQLETQLANLGYDYTDFTNQLMNETRQVELDVRANQLVTNQLQTIADDYGLKAEQMNFLFQSGLQKLGLDAHQAIAQISQMMASNDSNLVAQGAALIAQILGVTG